MSYITGERCALRSASAWIGLDAATPPPDDGRIASNFKNGEIQMKDELRRTYSRRDFVRVSAAAGAAIGLQSALLSDVFGAPEKAAPKKTGNDPYGGFRMGVQSYSFRHFPFPEAVERTKKLGLKYIELFPGHVDHTKVDGKDAKKLMEDAGVIPDSYGVVGFSKDEAASRKIFEFAKMLGLKSISADPTTDSFDSLDKLVAEYKIPIAIHNHGPNHKWGKPEVILAAIKDHHPLIGICNDTGHYLRANVDPVEATKILKGRVFGFHIKDFIDEKQEAPAGDARLKIAPLLKEARAQKFNGPCSLEYELSEDNPDAGMAKGLENFRKAVASLG